MGGLSGLPRVATTESSPRLSGPNRSSSCRASCRRSSNPVAAAVLAELDIRGILAELTEEGVDFLIIGGVAVGYHGHVRATKDVDVVPSPDQENYARLASALKKLEAQVEGAEEFDQAELPDPFDPSVLAERGNWVLHTRLGRLDIMQWQGDEPLWEKLENATIADQIAGVPIRMVGYEDLLSLKEDAARPEDRIDLERLREARAED
jgi:hypothetical protein